MKSMHLESKGESSRKCEGTTEDEKPLKKARYVWEVKGKYHLKETYNNNNNNSKNNKEDSRKDTTTVSPSGGTSGENLVVDHKECNNNNNENKCCIESFLAKTEAIMDSDDEDTKNIEKSILNEIPVTLVSPNPKNQDYYLQKWQARQIARGFVDNTINSVLETWVNPPFDPVDYVENCQNDGQVEDEGILMAIQSHGLRGGIQSAPVAPPDNHRKESPTSFMRSQEIEESTLDNFENYQNELIKEGMSSSSTTNSDSMSCDSSTQEVETAATGSSLELDDPIDFLNAAVSVAIQKKGLSYSY